MRRDVPRLPHNHTRFRIHQRDPLTKGGLPTYTVFDHHHGDEVLGATTSLAEAIRVCELLSNPADVAAVRALPVDDGMYQEMLPL